MIRILAAATALSLSAAPIAATAGTRANDIVPASAAVHRDVAPVADASQLGGSGPAAWIAVAFAFIVATALVIDGGDEGLSDG